MVVCFQLAVLCKFTLECAVQNVYSDCKHGSRPVQRGNESGHSAPCRQWDHARPAWGCDRPNMHAVRGLSQPSAFYLQMYHEWSRGYLVFLQVLLRSQEAGGWAEHQAKMVAHLTGPMSSPWRHPPLMRYNHNELRIQNTCDLCDFICMRLYILIFWLKSITRTPVHQWTITVLNTVYVY